MKTVSILCPTRERAQRAYNYARSALSTAANPQDVYVHFYVDNDDPQLEEYQRLFPFTSPTQRIRLTVGEPMSVSKSWNVLANQCIGDILLMGNDDLVHETPRWDEILENASYEYPDKIYCIYFNDGINHGKHCAFPAVSRKWYNTLGYFSPGIFEFLYNDTWVFDIAKRIGRVRYVPEVMVRHNHWTLDKKKDATTKRNRDDAPGRSQRDKTLYETTANDRIKAADLLRNEMR